MRNDDFYRIGFAVNGAEVARKHLARMHELLKALPPAPEPGAPGDIELSKYYEETAPMRTEIDEAAAIAIIFSEIALEEYIYDFAARHLGDNYVDRHLDRLSLKSKWVVIPRLVCDHEFDTGGQAYEALVCLEKARNKLVHPKTRDYHTLTEEVLAKYFEETSDLPITAEKSVEAIRLLAIEAEKFDKFASILARRGS